MNAIRQPGSGTSAHCVLERKRWRDQPGLVGAVIPCS
jgi:hypothetical protein